MAYRDNIAAKREDPTKLDGDNTAAALTPVSNQEKTIGQASKYRTVAVDAGKYNAGNQVKLGANTKGTGTVGRPIPQGRQPKTLPAVQNPSK